MSPNETSPPEGYSTHPQWGAVVAMALCAAVLISSEFLPVSLLTPIASDLGVTEGFAGQSISISGLFALVTSLFVSVAIGRRDRRRVLLLFTLLMVGSGCMVAFAPNAAILMVGRALLGIAIGGFWSISAAVVMRLVPQHSVPKALAILNGGNAAASTLAAPLGSFLGSIIGWRGAFFCVVPLALISFAWLWKALPGLPAQKSKISIKDVCGLMARPQVALGMAAVMLLFMGQFALFTYLRPYLEVVTKSNAAMLSFLLLIVGAAGIFGTYLIGSLLKSRLYSLLMAMPAIMGVIAIAIVLFGHSPLPAGILLTLWGVVSTASPVGWWAWLSKTMPHDAEAGGGLMVAIIQLAITLGAVFGGLVFDACGYTMTFNSAALILFVSSLMAFLTWQASLKKDLLAQTA